MIFVLSWKRLRSKLLASTFVVYFSFLRFPIFLFISFQHWYGTKSKSCISDLSQKLQKANARPIGYIIHISFLFVLRVSLHYFQTGHGRFECDEAQKERNKRHKSLFMLKLKGKCNPSLISFHLDVFVSDTIYFLGWLINSFVIKSCIVNGNLCCLDLLWPEVAKRWRSH